MSVKATIFAPRQFPYVVRLLQGIFKPPVSSVYAIFDLKELGQTLLAVSQTPVKLRSKKSNFGTENVGWWRFDGGLLHVDLRTGA
jgi:hypothetical protein